MSQTSQIRQNFNDAFDGDASGVPAQNYERMGQLEDQIKEMRAKFKKEEAQRKQYQDYARRKDEEIKKFHSDIKSVEDKLQEEVNKGQKQKTMIMQRDNKIQVLESKLNGGAPPTKQIGARGNQSSSQGPGVVGR